VRVSFVALVLALMHFACSSPAKTETAKPAPTNKCAFVADHLITLMTKTAQEAPSEEIDKVRSFFNTRCTADAWSPAAQECFLALEAKEDVNNCAAQLTDEQRSALEQPPSSSP
jgi:hypothetical protein